MPIIKKNRAFVNLGLTPNRFKRRGDSFIFVTAHVLETQNLYQDARVSCHVSSLAAQEKLNQVHFLTSSNTIIAAEMKEPLAFSLLSQVFIPVLFPPLAAHGDEPNQVHSLTSLKMTGA